MKKGIDVRISELAVIRHPELASLGDHIAIDEFVLVTTQLEMADYCHIAPFVSVIGSAKGLLKMGHFTTIAAGSRIICGSEGYDGQGLIGPVIPEQHRDTVKLEPVIFEPFSIVATNVVVMPGVTLGEGSAVGACSFVNEDTLPWTVYWGTPAKPRRVREHRKMKENARLLGYDL